MLKHLKPNNSNVQRVLNQVIDDPEFYMGDWDYTSYKDEIAFELGYEPVYIEWSILSRNANSDAIAIPLKDDTYYVVGNSNFPIPHGEIIKENQVYDSLQMIKREYINRELEYYYSI